MAAEHAVPFSVTTALPAIAGILGELPEIIRKAAACRDLPVPLAQERCAANPRTLKAPVATFVPLTKVEGFTDVGFPA